MKKQHPLAAIIGCLVVNICVGILYLWSVFKTPVMLSFNWSNQSALMVSSYMLFGFVTGNLIGGLLNDRKGPRLTSALGVLMFSVGIGLTAFLTKDTVNWMYLTYCALGGIGSGFAYGACLSCLQKWLPHRKGLASGMSVSAFAFSTVIFAPLSSALMAAHTVGGVVNFRPVFLTLAALFFTVGMAATYFVRLPGKEYIKSLPDAPTSDKIFTGRNFTLREAIKKPIFWLIFTELVFINGTWTLSVPLIKGLGLDRGLTESVAILTVSLTGVFNAGGRLVMAIISDKIGRIATIISLSVATLIGALLIVLNVQGAGFILAICIIAFGYGGPSSVNAAIITDFFGPKNSGTNYGVAMLGVGVSAVLFNTISSLFLNGDVTRTYIMAAISTVIPILAMLTIKKRLRKIGGEAVSLSATQG